MHVGNHVAVRVTPHAALTHFPCFTYYVMMRKKKNLTLALDERLLDRARIVAARKRTSVTELVRRSLEDLVAGDQARNRACASLTAMMEKPIYQVKPKSWTREELHERTVR